ncbi:MAG TPA: EfeM/EfeO family lipoprotein [Miltoncostaeaceae bacterium]|nr:EfeM/EfeO family lipoprotein [Miltoncostaeaceae bacterium]
MTRTRTALTALACAVPLAFGLSACGDDGTSADTAGETATAPALSVPADTAERVDRAVAVYTVWANGQVDRMIADTRVLTDAVRAGDLTQAQAAYATSRQGWERIEPIAGLGEDIDRKVDMRVEQFESVTDPEFTGWHRLEYLLFDRQTTAGAKPFADRLDADLAGLKKQLATIDVPAGDMAIGAAELIEEVVNGKITGEEDRYSKTDLWDMKANVEGAEKIVTLLTPALTLADPELLASISRGFIAVDASLNELRSGDGFVPFCPENDQYPSPLCTTTTVSAEQLDRMKTQLGALAEDLAKVPGALGIS